MSKISSAITLNLNGFLTEKGRRFLFGKDNDGNPIRFENGVDNFKTEKFSIYDSDVNYDSETKLQTGDLPSVSGTLDKSTCLKTAVDIKRKNAVLFLGSNVPSISFNQRQYILREGSSTNFSLIISHFPTEELERNVTISLNERETTLPTNAFSFSFSTPNEVSFDESTGTEIEFTFESIDRNSIPVGESRRVVLDLNDFQNSITGEINKAEFIVSRITEGSVEEAEQIEIVPISLDPDFSDVFVTPWESIAAGDGCLRFWRKVPLSSPSVNIDAKQESNDNLNGDFIINESSTGFLVDQFATNIKNRKTTAILYQDLNIKEGEEYKLIAEYGFERGRVFDSVDFGGIEIEFMFFDRNTGISGDILEQDGISGLDKQTLFSDSFKYENLNPYNVSNNSFQIEIENNQLIENETPLIKANKSYNSVGAFIKYNPTAKDRLNKRRQMMFAAILNKFQILKKQIVSS